MIVVGFRRERDLYEYEKVGFLEKTMKQRNFLQAEREREGFESVRQRYGVWGFESQREREREREKEWGFGESGNFEKQNLLGERERERERNQ